MCSWSCIFSLLMSHLCGAMTWCYDVTPVISGCRMSYVLLVMYSLWIYRYRAMTSCYVYMTLWLYDAMTLWWYDAMTMAQYTRKECYIVADLISEMGRLESRTRFEIVRVRSCVYSCVRDTMHVCVTNWLLDDLTVILDWIVQCYSLIRSKWVHATRRYPFFEHVSTFNLFSRFHILYFFYRINVM